MHQCTLNEQCLRVIYNDRQSNIKDLLDSDRTIFIHDTYKHPLAIEMCKVINGSSPKLMKETFQLRFYLKLDSHLPKSLV